MEKENASPRNFGSRGFFYGYVVVMVAFSFQAIVWGVHNSFGIFFNPLMSEFHWSRALISGAASLSFLMNGAGSILMGRLNDRFGPRLIMSINGVFLGAGYLLMSRVDNPWELYLFYSILIGLGVSGTDVALLSTVARWFVKARGMMSGVTKMGAGVGMLVLPIFIHWLIASYNWRSAFMALGIIILISFTLLSRFLVRDPGGKGLFPDGAKEESAEGPDNGARGMTLREAAGSRQFWSISAAYFLVVFCIYTILMHIVPHAIDLGISASNAARVLAAMGGVSIAGRLVMGGASDRIGNKSALVICYLLFFVCLVWLLFAKELWMLYVFAIIYGFAHGGFFALGSPTVADLFGTGSLGVIFGILIFISTIGGAIGPLVAGYIFDVTNSYGSVFKILTVLSLLGLGAVITLSPVRHGQRDRRANRGV